MSQPVAFTVPLTTPLGLTSAAVRPLNPVAAHAAGAARIVDEPVPTANTIASRIRYFLMERLLVWMTGRCGATNVRPKTGLSTDPQRSVQPGRRACDSGGL